MNSSVRADLCRKLECLDEMPSLPVVVTELLSCLDKPSDQLRVSDVSDLISRDNALAARCLHLANSPLFGRYQSVDTIHAAVIAIGLRRMREIAVSCCLLSLPTTSNVIDPVFFWEHSVGCALMSRRVAQLISFPNTDKAYLAGLLHDIGVVAHFWLVPKEFCSTYEMAKNSHTPLHEAELALLGMTHCESGRVLGERWHLGDDLVAVIAGHHQAEQTSEHRLLVAIVTLADLLCRMNNMGYGFPEDRQIDLMDEPAFECLMQECTSLRSVDWARLTLEMEGYLEEVRRLVALLYRAR